MKIVKRRIGFSLLPDFCKFSVSDAPKNGRYLTTDSGKVDEPFKVEEAETVNTPPPPTEKVLSCFKKH